ncbi:SbcC/MukB-like Walker B domain-containing protein [Streptomyces sp. NPDC050625]|uniref:SbcC/MukB-like Walker B domain-containing protein n=1 Tax=Streptomyces sp. NPDC050625 TaxID=3154629 RepID=UPI003418BC30
MGSADRFDAFRALAARRGRPGGRRIESLTEAAVRRTRARHSRLSGGEQFVSLRLPLFAAAHAMLNFAHPDALRLLALDGAFAGVDDTGRGELMSLAAQFDLDLFMTDTTCGPCTPRSALPPTTTSRTPPSTTPSPHCCCGTAKACTPTRPKS